MTKCPESTLSATHSSGRRRPTGDTSLKKDIWLVLCRAGILPRNLIKCGPQPFGASMQDREKLAAHYGFNSFAGLLDISGPLPMLPGDKAKSSVARSPLGYWLVWEDVYLPAEAQERGNPPA